jgi:hypothetical protein
VGRHWLIVDVEPISGDAFAQRTRFDRHRLTGMIAYGDHNFNAMQKEFFKGVRGQRFDTTQGNALALPGLPHPITQIAEPVQLHDLIQARTTQKVASILAEDTKAESRPGTSSGITHIKPFQRFAFRICGRAPRQPAPYRFGGLKNCANKSRRVGAEKRAKYETFKGK